MKIVSAFGHERDATAAALLRQGAQRLRHRAKSLRRQPHAGQRIAFVRIEACRDQEQVRPELTNDRHDHFVKRDMVIIDGRTHLEWQVHGCTSARSLANFISGSSAWVIWILMRRDVQHTRVALEGVLRAIAMMNVVINDRNARGTQRLRMSCRDRDVVEQAEAHRPIAFGVMTRRPNEREG